VSGHWPHDPPARAADVVDFLFELKSVLLYLKTVRFERISHQVGHVGFAEAVLFLARLDARENR
jgi:hypothetical protein